VTFAFGSVAHNVFFDQQTGAPADIDGLNANVSVQRTFATRGRITTPATFIPRCMARSWCN